MPRAAIHPGEHLSEQLSALTMSAAEFARRIEVPTNRVTELMKGRRSVTADTALRLARAFNTSARFWMNLQTMHDLRLAEAAASKVVMRIAPVVGIPARRAPRALPARAGSRH